MPELSPRGQSAEIVKCPEAYDTAAMLEQAAGMENAGQALELLKPLHYAKLAQTIGLLLDDMQAKRTERPPTGFLASEYEKPTLWLQLASDIRATVYDSIAGIEGSQVFEETSSVSRYIGLIDENRYISLKVQLMAGMDTASNTMLTLLRNFPAIARYHNLPQERVALTAAARGSTGLPLRLAMTCVNRMMAAQAALTSREAGHEGWSDIDSVLEPGHFKTATGADGSAGMRYVDFLGLEVAPGYTVGPERPPVSRQTKVGEIACYQTVTIGCPITLLQGRMQELWSWYIDAVDSKNLWDVAEA